MLHLLLVACLLQDAPAAPPGDGEVAQAIAQGAQLLVRMQETYTETPRARNRRGAASRPASAPASQPTDGAPREWPYEGVYRVDQVIPSGYRTGGTAIVCMALMLAPGFASDTPRRAAFDRGLRFVLDTLERDPLLQSGFDGTYDVRGWAHTYGLEFLLRAMECKVVDGALATRCRAMAEQLVRTLTETEIKKRGGWNYARGAGIDVSAPSTFMTAPTIQALLRAKAAGLAVDPALIERALDALQRARLEDGAFQYSTSDKKTGQGFEAVPGACARMAACETTLLRADRGSVERVRGAVQAFFTHWEWLEKRRQQTGTHVPPYMIAPYYFHYGHTYVAQAIEHLPEAERPALRGQLRALYWQTRETDGGWNDRVFPRSEAFGTAFAMLGLMMPELARR